MSREPRRGDALFAGEHTAPTIQWIESQTTDAAGSVALRFCHFSHAGRFQRWLLVVAGGRVAARSGACHPRVRDLLLRIASGVAAEAG